MVGTPQPRPGAKPPFGGIDREELTTMDPECWQTMLVWSGYDRRHPSESKDIIEGIVHGMDIGFTGDREVNRESKNLSSALESEEVENKVNELIMENVRAGKTAGPFTRRPFKYFSYSPIGAVPKAVHGREWRPTDVRVIHHLSHPFGGDSINNQSVDIPCCLGSVDAAANSIRRLGKNCWLTKIDIKAAYKLVPVRFEDWSLLGFKWRGNFFYERTLPFGLKSSCRQWELYSTAMHDFLLTLVGVEEVDHYVDDFFLADQLESDAIEHLRMTIGLFDRLGIPIAHDKTISPTRRLTYLGVELDSATLTMRLSESKLIQLRQLLQDWNGKQSANQTELQSLCGKLNWACAVIRPGRSFLRRIIDHTKVAGHGEGTIIPISVRLDIKWWSDCASEYNGVSIMYDIEWTSSTKLHLFTDACNTGYGASFGNRWICGSWTAAELCTAQRGNKQDRYSMPYLELRSLTLALASWGHLLSGKNVEIHCDCLPIVQSIEKRSCREGRAMDLIRAIHTIAARHRFDFKASHVRGVDNVLADALSRNNIPLFHFHQRSANPKQDPTLPIPAPIKLN